MFKTKNPEILFDVYDGKPLLTDITLAEYRYLNTKVAVSDYLLEAKDAEIAKLKADNDFLREQLDLAVVAAAKTEKEQNNA